MKRIFIMDGSGIKEFVPAEFFQKSKSIPVENYIQENPSEDKLLTIAGLVNKFQVTRPTIYAWIEKGLLKKIPLGGRVLFHPHDIDTLIQEMRGISS